MSRPLCNVFQVVGIVFVSFAHAQNAGQPNILPFSGVQIPKVVTSSEDPFKLDAGDVPPLPVDLPDAKEAAKMATSIVQGMTQAFLGAAISDSERECFSGGASELAGDVTGTSLQTVEKLHSLFGHAKSSFNDFSALAKTGTAPPSQMQVGSGGMQATASSSQVKMSPEGMPIFGYGSGYPPPGGYPMWAKGQANSGLHTAASAMTTLELARLTSLELSETLTDMFNVEDKVIKKCLKGDTLDWLKLAKAHAKNISYVGGHLIANGPEIIDYLAGAVTTADAHDHAAFGKNMGAALRKVFLSRGEGPSSLQGRLEQIMKDIDPDNIMKELEPETIQKVTAGLVGALFGEANGFKVNLEAKGSGEILTTLPPSFGVTASESYYDMAPKGTLRFEMPAKFRTATEDTEVNIDLQSCVAGNMELMKQAWKPVVALSEQFMEGHCTGAVRSLCTSLYTVVMTDIQQGLRTCGFTPEQETVLVHSLWAGDLLRANLSMPKGKASTRDVTVTMAKAVENWHAERYTHFGRDMGELMRDMVVDTYPEKFTLDERGRIRMIIEESQATWRANPTFVGVFMVMSIGFVFVLTCLAVTRVQRSRHYPHGHFTRVKMLAMDQFVDPEAATTPLSGPARFDREPLE